MKLLTDELIKNIRNRDPRNEVEAFGAPYTGSDEARGFIIDHLWQHRTFGLKLSLPITSEEMIHAYSLGMLRKTELNDGKYYWGVCRNAHVARWSKTNNLFLYRRFKGNWYTEKIPYPSDQIIEEWIDKKLIGFDIFLPWLEVEPLPHEVVGLEEL